MEGAIGAGFSCVCTDMTVLGGGGKERVGKARLSLGLRTAGQAVTREWLTASCRGTSGLVWRYQQNAEGYGEER